MASHGSVCSPQIELAQAQCTRFTSFRPHAGCSHRQSWPRLSALRFTSFRPHAGCSHRQSWSRLSALDSPASDHMLAAATDRAGPGSVHSIHQLQTTSWLQPQTELAQAQCTQIHQLQTTCWLQPQTELVQAQCTRFTSFRPHAGCSHRQSWSRLSALDSPASDHMLAAATDRAGPGSVHSIHQLQTTCWLQPQTELVQAQCTRFTSFRPHAGCSHRQSWSRLSALDSPASDHMLAAATDIHAVCGYCTQVPV